MLYTINNALYSTRSGLRVINIYYELKINVISNVKNVGNEVKGYREWNLICRENNTVIFLQL